METQIWGAEQDQTRGFKTGEEAHWSVSIKAFETYSNWDEESFLAHLAQFLGRLNYVSWPLK